jgi:hypothetical protein
MERTLLTIAAATAFALSAPALAGAQSAAVLPNLVQVVPRDIGVKTVHVRGRPKFRLGFTSATENRGAGPMTVHGHRASGRDRTMDVDQIVTTADGTLRTVKGVGDMRYVISPDHRHWHLIGFARYELRPVGGQVVRRDRKTGFCLGDRYKIHGARELPNFQPFPLQGDTCGKGQPGLRGLFAGISTGWGDPYGAQLEGQFIDVTGLPAGMYVLTHRANPARVLVESSYEDNAASALLDISWPRGAAKAPRVRVFRKCRGGDQCGG